MPTFFLTAAEHSGDALGASLIHALRRRFPEASFVGVGGDLMASAGCRLLSNSVKRSAMLDTAVLNGARYWWKMLKEIRNEFRALQPDVVIPIDSSGINLRIAAIAKAEKLPVCYYVAPQVWASRPWRIKKIVAAVDTLCCVLPFEEKYFKDRRVNAAYVGHPMFDTPAEVAGTDPERLKPPLPGEDAEGEKGLKVALFPGSRRAEIDGQMPPMLKVIAEIKARFPGVSFVAAAPSEELAWQIRHHLRLANTPVDIRVGHTDAIIRWADLVLVKSGTATLQIARHHKPMVVMYALARWKWHLVGRFIINTQYMALVNILANRRLVPEHIPFYGSPAQIARDCIELLAHPQLRTTMTRELRELVAPLQPQAGAGAREGGGGALAADRVAEQVAECMIKTPRRISPTAANDHL